MSQVFLGYIKFEKFESHWSILVVGQLEVGKKVDIRYIACSQDVERKIIFGSYLR